MDRRAFLAGGAALLAAPLAVEAQQASKVARIGVVVGGAVDYTDNLRQGLRELGWVEGQNFVVVKRAWGGGAPSGSPRSSRI